MRFFLTPHTVPVAKKLLWNHKIVDPNDDISAGVISVALAKVAAIQGTPPIVSALIHSILLILPEVLEPNATIAQRLTQIEHHLKHNAIAKVSDPAELPELVQQVRTLGERVKELKTSSDAAEAASLENLRTVMAAREQGPMAQPEQGGWQTVPARGGGRGPPMSEQSQAFAMARGDPRRPAGVYDRPPETKAAAAAEKRLHQAGCRVLVEPSDPDFAPLAGSPVLSAKENIMRARLAVDLVWEILEHTNLVKEKGFETKPSLDFRSVTRLPKGGLLYEMSNREQASILSDSRFAVEFERKFGAVTCKGQHPFLLFERAPITFNPSDAASIRTLEAENQLNPGEILSAHWIKPETRRTNGQEFAHLMVELRSEDVADELIEFGARVEYNSVVVRRNVERPTRCLKCQRFAHKAAKCKAPTDVCSGCGGAHRTSECNDKGKIHCVNCKNDSHSAWSLSCPAYAQENARLNVRKPENLRRFFNPKCGTAPPDHHRPSHPLPLRPATIGDALADFVAPAGLRASPMARPPQAGTQRGAEPERPGRHRLAREGSAPWDVEGVITPPLAPIGLPARPARASWSGRGSRSPPPALPQAPAPAEGAVRMDLDTQHETGAYSPSRPPSRFSVASTSVVSAIV